MRHWHEVPVSKLIAVSDAAYETEGVCEADQSQASFMAEILVAHARFDELKSGELALRN